MKRRVPALVAALALATLAIPFTAGLVSAHSGSVTVSQTCQSFSTDVYLANNVTSDRTVFVVTTIPGTTGMAGNHYNTTGNSGNLLIWDAAGPAVTSGTVTLKIYNGNTLEFTAFGTLPNPGSCASPTSSPFQGSSATPTTKPTPTQCNIVGVSANSVVTSPPCATPFQGSSATPTTKPTASPTHRPTDPPTPTASHCNVVGVSANAVVTPTPCPTPFQSFQGETATPFQSFQGQTSNPTTTPPPTSTGNDGSGSSTPLFALLICFAFGTLGLAAVAEQRRSIRR